MLRMNNTASKVMFTPVNIQTVSNASIQVFCNKIKIINW